jgi:RimJ/RimL family protein N-acetyltransferase
VVGALKIVSACRFDTDRLRIESWDIALADGAARKVFLAELSWLLTPAVMKFLPPPLQLSEGPDAIDGWVLDRDRESHVFCVRNRATLELAGLLILVTFEEPEGEASVRLGYLLAEDVWGQGLASELIKGFVRWCQDQSLTVVLQGGVEQGNGASARVLIKAGFERAEELSEHGAETYRLNL